MYKACTNNVFNSTIKTTFTNGIKNERILERDYTNILTKLEDDLSSNFEDTGLRSMTFFCIIRHIGRANRDRMERKRNDSKVQRQSSKKLGQS